VLYSVGIALVFSFIFMWFVGKCGLPLFYFFILATNLGIWIAIVQLLREMGTVNKQKRIAGAAILGLVSLFMLLVIGCFAKKIKLAIAIVGAAAEFTASTQRIVFVLLLFGVVFLVTILMWLTGLAGIYSSEGFKPLQIGDKNPILIPYFTAKLVGMMALMVFCLYWFIFNLIFMVRFVVMNSAASFYFSSNKTKMGSA